MNFLLFSQKLYKIFQVLHPKPVMETTMQTVGSKALTEAGPRRRMFIIYQDLLRVHILSGNRSLRDYMEVIESGQEVLDKFESGDGLNEDEQARLKVFLDKADTLFENSLLGERARIRGEETSSRQIPGINERVAAIRQSISAREGQTITGRISEMFLRPIGLESFDRALDIMRQAKVEAQTRGAETVAQAKSGHLTIEAGDFLKGVNPDFVDKILQNGSVANEFLGVGFNKADATPLDTDVALVSEEMAKEDFSEILARSASKDYGNIVFALKQPGASAKDSAISRCGWQPEIFQINPQNSEHYGIRTGFPTTEIDFMVAKQGLTLDKERLEGLFVEIAKNGWYIPVVDEAGQIIFYPHDYQRYRRAFEGISKFDGENYEFRGSMPRDPLTAEVADLKPGIAANAERTGKLEEKIVGTITGILGELGIKMKEKYSHSIRGTEIFQTGSSGRHTNVPGKFDFDFSAYLDVDDFPRSAEIAARLKEVMSPEKDNSHSGGENYYQIRFEGVQVDGESVDIDIGLSKKSELLYFASHDGVTERLGWIKMHEGEEAYLLTLANIVLAKKKLSGAHAYKKTEESGLGGIGVENWILQSGGSFTEALRTFYAASQENGQTLGFNQFRARYQIIDPGLNLKNLKHDNFVNNLSEASYQKMLDLAREVLSGRAGALGAEAAG